MVLPPAVTDCDAGVAESEKFGVEEVTLNVTVAVWLRLPLVPVTVSVKLPAVVELVVDTVNVDDPDPLIEDGLKLAVAPPGEPLTLKDTVPLKPFNAEVEMV